VNYPDKEMKKIEIYGAYTSANCCRKYEDQKNSVKRGRGAAVWWTLSCLMSPTW
jgi:hypothetical protein